MEQRDVRRFWSKVLIGDDCWTWTGKPGTFGHGRFGYDKKIFGAHRVSYELTNGPIPEGLVIDHKCRNPICVNPSHLRAVTQKQNTENCGASKNSKTGIRGVFWHKAIGKWAASASHAGVSHIAGYFTDIADAEQAAIKLRNELFTHNDEDR